MNQKETLILKSLISNDKYCRAVLPYIKPEYFESNVNKIIFKSISQYLSSYNDQPSIEAIDLIISENTTLKTEDRNEAIESLQTYQIAVNNTHEWLLEETEKFCKDRALELAVLNSIHIINDEEGKADRGAIPDLLKEALAISFDPSIGHDFIENFSDRYDFYHRKEEKLPVHIDLWNQVMSGGF